VSIIFVTSEKKEDWWKKRGHEIVSPHVELRREFQEYVKKPFWMYRTQRFLEMAQEKFMVELNTSSIEETNTISDIELIDEIEHQPATTSLRQMQSSPDYARTMERDALGLPDYSRVMERYAQGLPEYSRIMERYLQNLPDYSGSITRYLQGLPDYSGAMERYAFTLPDYFRIMEQFQQGLPNYSNIMERYLESSLPVQDQTRKQQQGDTNAEDPKPSQQQAHHHGASRKRQPNAKRKSVKKQSDVDSTT
jgi:hypothetical protein